MNCRIFSCLSLYNFHLNWKENKCCSMTSFIEDNNTEEAGVWVGLAFNQVGIYYCSTLLGEEPNEGSYGTVMILRRKSSHHSGQFFSWDIFKWTSKITWFIFETSHFTNEWKEVSPIWADINARYSAQSSRSLSAIWSYFINCPLWHIYF